MKYIWYMCYLLSIFPSYLWFCILAFNSIEVFLNHIIYLDGDSSIFSHEIAKWVYKCNELDCLVAISNRILCRHLFYFVTKGLQDMGYSLDQPAFYTACQVNWDLPQFLCLINWCKCHLTLMVFNFFKLCHFFNLNCQSFDQNRSGKFRLDDYIALCIFLKSARSVEM